MALYSWVKDPVKVQNRPMDFNVVENEKVTDKVSDSRAQLSIKKLLPIVFGVVSRRVPSIVGKSYQNISSFSKYFLCEARFSSTKKYTDGPQRGGWGWG